MLGDRVTTFDSCFLPLSCISILNLMLLPDNRFTVSVLENRAEMNRKKTLSVIIASLLLLAATAKAAKSHNSLEIWHTDLEANASTLKTQSLPFILSTRDEPDDDCQRRGVCPS